MKGQYTQPVKILDVINVTIENIGEKGDGIARHQKFVIITPNTQIEKNYKVRIKKVFPTYAIAEVIQEVNKHGI